MNSWFHLYSYYQNLSDLLIINIHYVVLKILKVAVMYHIKIPVILKCLCNEFTWCSSN